MVNFQIQPDSDIPASTQLYSQIRFAIASRQFPPGHCLPSTRKLAMQTGLHRNTISKVYRQLEQDGVVDARAGAGIFVRAQGDEGSAIGNRSPLLAQHPQAYKLVQKSLDDLINQGCSLSQAREIFLAEVDWRLRCSAQVLVTTPLDDIGAGELMLRELEQALQIPVQLVPLEELGEVLDRSRSGTVVTSQYFIQKAEVITSPKSVRVIPVDIYDYKKEFRLLTGLPKDTCAGVVSLSSGILRVAEIMIHSSRGEDLLLMTAQTNDTYKLNAMVRNAQIIVCDQASYNNVKAAIQAAREDIIRPPRVECCENYIGEKSIGLLKRELGLE